MPSILFKRPLPGHCEKDFKNKNDRGAFGELPQAHIDK
jgi:hypothetical protein